MGAEQGVRAESLARSVLDVGHVGVMVVHPEQAARSVVLVMRVVWLLLLLLLLLLT